MNKILDVFKKEPILIIGALGVAAITIYTGIVQGDASGAVVNDVIAALTAFAGRSQVSPVQSTVAPPAK